MMQSLSGRAITFLSQLILAGLLAPADFGEIGLAYSVTTIVSALIGFGIDEVLLQRLRSIRLWAASAFWISLGLAAVGMVLLLLAAPAAAAIYGNPTVPGLIAVSALSLPLTALSTVPYVRLRAAMNFKFIASYASIEMLFVQVSSIILAWSGFGAYSFVIPLPVFAAIKAAVFWHEAPSRITPRFRRKQVRYLLSSGFALLGSRLLIEAVNQGDYVLLGLMASDTVVGIYFFAFRLAAQPLRMLAGNFNSVLFPVLAQLNADPVRQRAAALTASRLLAYAVMPFCFLQAAVADPLLHMMFGNKWAAAIPLVQILSLGLPSDAISWIAGAVLSARGEFRRMFYYMCCLSPAFFIIVAVGTYLGSSTGTAIAVALYYAIVTPVLSCRVFQLGKRLNEFRDLYIMPLVAAGLAVESAYLISLLPVFASSYVSQIMVTLVLAPLFYLAALRLFLPRLLNEILDRFLFRQRVRQSG